MRIPFCGILLISASLLLSTCNSHSEALSLLREARRIIEINPDSALILLDSIANPKELSEEDQMEYHVRMVQARYKNFVPISEDTAIFEARDYFAQKAGSNRELNFSSYFYSGCVYREREQYDNALKEYRQALNLSQKYQNEEQQAFVLYNIGDLYFDMRFYKQALTHYLQAADKYVNNPNKKLVSLQAAAQASLLSGNFDNAFVYFKAGLNLAREQSDKVQEANFMQNIAIAFFEQGDYTEAISLLHRARDINPDTIQVARYYLNLANIYHASGEQDSLVYYTRKLQESAKESPDIYFQSAVNEFLAQVFTESGEYQTAIQYLQAKNSCLLQIMEENNVTALAEAEQKYNMATKETLLANEKIRNYRLSLFASITVLVLILTAVTGFCFYNKHRQQRKENNRLREETEKNAYLNQVYRNCLGNITLFKNYVNDLAISYEQKKDKREASAGYAKITKAIEEMEASIYEGYAPFVSDFLRSLKLMNDKQISRLRTEDQLLVTLIYARHEHAQIAALLRISNHALSTRKSRLRDKLLKSGLSEQQISKIVTSK